MTLYNYRQVKGKKSENERLLKNDSDSSLVEDFVYKLPPPKPKSDISDRTPKDLPKDVISVLDVKTVSNIFLYSNLLIKTVFLM